MQPKMQWSKSEPMLKKSSEDGAWISNNSEIYLKSQKSTVHRHKQSTNLSEGKAVHLPKTIYFQEDDIPFLAVLLNAYQSDTKSTIQYGIFQLIYWLVKWLT